MSVQTIVFPDYAKHFGPSFFDGRYWYKVSLSAGVTTPHFIVFDTRTNTFFGGTITLTGRSSGPTGLPVRCQRRRFGASLIVFNVDTGNRVYVDQVDIDVSAQTATVTNLVNVTNSDVVVNETFDSHQIGDNVALTFYQYPHVTFIDPETGATTRKIDTGLGTYRPRVGMCFSTKGDDLYVLLGRHLAGDPFRLLKVYAGTVTVISGSTVGGDSPHTWRSTIYACRGRVLFTGSGFSVVNSQPPIHWFSPRTFTVLGSTSLTAIHTYARTFGYWPIGESDSEIMMIAVVWNNVWGYETARSLRLILLNRANFAYTRNVNLLDLDYRSEIMTCWNIMGLPIFDRQRRRLYVPFNRSFADNQNGMYIIDLSQYLDQFGINEFNEMMYYVGEYRRPTSLYLTASVV